MMLRTLATLLVVLGSAAWPHAVELGTTPFDLTDRGEIVVPVMVDGEGPFTFLLDTGASHSVVSDELARRIGAEAVAKTAVTSVAGREWRVVVRIDRLALGPYTNDGVLASVVGAGALSSTGRIDGLIGQDVLGARRYTLDFRQHLVEWRESFAPPAHTVSTLALRAVAGRFLAELPQGDQVIQLVPDSAAGAVVLFEPARVALPMTAASGQTPLSGLTRDVDAPVVLLRQLRVGDFTWHDVPAVLVEHRPGDAAAEGDGLLPLSRFLRVTFDGPGRRLIVEDR
jgi:Aspartyl protease